MDKKSQELLSWAISNPKSHVSYQSPFKVYKYLKQHELNVTLNDIKRELMKKRSYSAINSSETKAFYETGLFQQDLTNFGKPI